MHDKAVAQITALFRRNDLPQGHLHFLRLLDAIHKANFVAQPDAMGVCYNGGLAEDIPHDKVGALAANAGQGKQLLKGGGDFTVVFVPQHLHTGRDIPGFGVAQAAGLDDGFNFFRLRSCQCGDAGVLGKQIFHHDVDPCIGALCGQPDTDQKLPRMVVIQRAGSIRVFLFQPGDDFQRKGFLGRKVFRGGWFPGHIAPLDSSKMCFYDNMFCKDCKSFGDYLRIIFRNCLVLRAKMRYNI